MSQLDWQNVAALAVVASTMLYVGRRVWLKLSRRSGIACGSCGDCPAEKSPGPQVIAIQSLVDSARAGE